MDTLIKQLDGYSLWKVSTQDLSGFSKFVADTNMIKHQGRNAYKNEIDSVLESKIYEAASSSYFALKDKFHNIVGTVRNSLWSSQSHFSIEDEFNIDVASLVKKKKLSPPEIWHVARLAINLDSSKLNCSLRKRYEMLTVLLLKAFSPIYKNDDNVMIAESDVRIHESLHRFGVDNEVIGEKKMCLGSYTVPVMNTGKGLSKFVNNNIQYLYV